MKKKKAEEDDDEEDDEEEVDEENNDKKGEVEIFVHLPRFFFLSSSSSRRNGMFEAYRDVLEDELSYLLVLSVYMPHRALFSPATWLTATLVGPWVPVGTHDRGGGSG